MNRLILLVAVALVTGAVVAGLSVTGGPEYARMQANDLTRLSDLRGFGAQERCRAILAAGSDTPRCEDFVSDHDWRDPATEEPYLRRDLPDGGFEVCAMVETDPADLGARIERDLVVDGQTVCLRYRKIAAADWATP